MYPQYNNNIKTKQNKKNPRMPKQTTTTKKPTPKRQEENTVNVAQLGFLIIINHSKHSFFLRVESNDKILIGCGCALRWRVQGQPELPIRLLSEKEREEIREKRKEHIRS
jgi:hypothetical protein